VTHAAPSSPSTSAAPFVEKANAYLLPVYARPNFVLSHGKGSYVWDTDGRKYLDFCAGIAVNALGHADDEFVKVSIIQASVIALLYMRGSYRVLRESVMESICLSQLLFTHRWDVC
jgi:acetylornithine/succinyldiaminopimelate/putrescine aminotransferase